jgi:hypothetical protein
VAPLALTLALCVLSVPAAADEPVVVPPSLLELRAAVLPEGTPARTGEVRLSVTVDPEGRVTATEALDGLPDPWRAAAVAATLESRFTPATVDGVAVPVQFELSYTFEAAAERGPLSESRASRRPEELSAKGALTGKLLERGTRTPVVGALVLARQDAGGPEQNTVTDADGAFRFDGLSAGTWTVEVVEGTHAAATLLAEVSAEAAASGGPVPLPTAYVEATAKGAYETVVRAKDKPAAATEVALTGAELTRVPGSFGDPTRVVATLPGVSRSPFGLGYFVVRGANIENTGFFIDGHPALFLYHFLGGPAVVHPELVGKITFYPGGYPAEYGRLAGGVVALETKEPPRDRWHLDAEIDVLKASVLGSVPFDEGRGSIAAAVRRSYFEVFVPLIVDGVSLSYTDYQLRVSWQPFDALRLRMFVLGAEDRFSAQGVGDDEETERTQDVALGFHRVQVAADWDVAERLTWSSSTAFEYDHTEGQRASPDDDTIEADIDGWFVQVRSKLRAEFPEEGWLEGGIDAFLSDLGADLRIPALPPLGDPRPPQFDPITLPFNFDSPYISLAPFVSASFRPWKNVEFLPGVRFTFDRYGDAWRAAVDPKATIRWTFLPTLTWKGTASLAHQPPQPFQTPPPYGDPSIPLTKALQTSTGFEWRPLEGWLFSVEGFYNALSNLARPEDTISSDDGELTRTLWKADVSGRAYGMEVFIRKELGEGWYGWVSYTLMRSERRFPPGDFQLAAFDQTHVLNMATSFDLGAGFVLGARFQLTTGTPFFPVVGSRYDADRGRYQPLYGDAQGRLPVFHRLDIRLDKQWLFDAWILAAFIDIQNVYNAQNPEAQRYSYDFSIRSDGAGVPILPTLGVRATF